MATAEEHSIPLRDYVDSELAAVRASQEMHIEQVRIMSEHAQRAVDKAEASIQRRLDLLNEFRAQAADESAKFALREVIDDRLRDLAARVDRAEGKAEGQTDTLSRVIAVGSLLVAALGLILLLIR